MSLYRIRPFASVLEIARTGQRSGPRNADGCEAIEKIRLLSDLCRFARTLKDLLLKSFALIDARNQAPL
jgi:hypothetical protein